MQWVGCSLARSRHSVKQYMLTTINPEAEEESRTEKQVGQGMDKLNFPVLSGVIRLPQRQNGTV